MHFSVSVCVFFSFSLHRRDDLLFVVCLLGLRGATTSKVILRPLQGFNTESEVNNNNNNNNNNNEMH